LPQDLAAYRSVFSVFTEPRQSVCTVSFHEDQQSDSGPIVTVRGYNARRGYDLVTGVGTPNAALLVRELVALARQSTRQADRTLLAGIS